MDHVTQEIRQQMESILALKSRLAGPLPAADALACDEGVASTGESVRRIAAPPPKSTPASLTLSP